MVAPVVLLKTHKDHESIFSYVFTPLLYGDILGTDWGLN